MCGECINKALFRLCGCPIQHQNPHGDIMETSGTCLLVGWWVPVKQRFINRGQCHGPSCLGEHPWETCGLRSLKALESQQVEKSLDPLNFLTFFIGHLEGGSVAFPPASGLQSHPFLQRSPTWIQGPGFPRQVCEGKAQRCAHRLPRGQRRFHLEEVRREEDGRSINE